MGGDMNAEKIITQFKSYYENIIGHLPAMSIGKIETLYTKDVMI